MRARTVQKRNAFTLIELLVVIAIIVILMALTVGVLSRVWAFMDETKTVTEINKLAESCTIFKSTFGRNPPARIVLSQVPDNGAGAAPVGSYRWGIQQGGPLGQLFMYSSEYLTSIFPGINLGGGHQWSGVNSNTAWFVLEGEEAIVYFLGGMRSGGSAPTGFNTDKTNPTFISSGARLGPFFQFDESRIDFNSPNSAPPAWQGSQGFFPVYKDYYGTPYAYFLARTPGMNNYWFPGAPQMSGLTAQQQQFLSDCYLLTRSKEPANVDRSFVPLYQSMLPVVNPTAIQFLKPDTFQIVSAGKDKLFGCGGNYRQTDPENSPFDYINPGPPIFVPPGGIATTDEKKAVFDNLSNVSSGRLVPQ